MKKKTEKLYWTKKKGKHYLIGANDFNIMDQGKTLADAKEIFLERMIVMYGDLLDKLRDLHMAYSGFDLPDIPDLEEMEVEDLNRENMPEEEYNEKMAKILKIDEQNGQSRGS